MSEYAECTCGHYYAGHDADGCAPECGCSRPGSAPQSARPDATP